VHTAEFDWLSQAMNGCEAEAARQSDMLFFMVVPLAPTKGFDSSLKAKALESVGPATLFESKVALGGLRSGALRISSESFILHVLDTTTNVSHRWNSATGVSTLTSKENVTAGPFKIRLQTAPDDTADWSKVTADGTATCHWVFAMFRR
jgi:hypothetical protein